MSVTNLRGSRSLLTAGYVLLVLGGLDSLWQRWSVWMPTSLLGYEIAVPLSYALVAWAWWSLVTALADRYNAVPGSRRALRIFSVSAVVLAAGYVALLVALDAYSTLAGDDLTYVLYVIGFTLLAIGFWRASGAFE